MEENQVRDLFGDFKKVREAETKEATTDFELGLPFLLKF